ncbi:MAG: hypothetical protein KAH56_03650 [Candidatus Krumholzibacteria bacterium]|nr:hypothetical protein [Candidatus Krumholzibacteria bacterium]
MIKMTRDEAQLLLAGIRVLNHLNGRSPTPEDLAELLQQSASSVRLQLAFLDDLGIVSLVKSAYETHAEIRDHLAVEEFPEEGGPEISQDLLEFDRRKSEEAEKMSKLFESGEHQEKQQRKMDQMGEDLKDFKKRKPANPFGDD